MNGIKFTNLLLVFTIFIAHFFAPTGYIFYQHTMSELAGQGVPNSWILTTGFYVVGMFYVFFSWFYFKAKILPGWLFGLTLANGVMTILLGVFPTSFDGLVNTTIVVNETVVVLHRYVAYASNALTITSILLHLILANSIDLKMKHASFFVLTFIFSGFFILYNQDIRGIFQRLILLTNSFWTVWLYGYIDEKPKHLLTQIKARFQKKQSRQ
jgi:hypothetical protein